MLAAVITVLPSILRASRRPALMRRYRVACETDRMCSVSLGEYNSRMGTSRPKPQDVMDIHLPVLAPWPQWQRVLQVSISRYVRLFCVPRREISSVLLEHQNFFLAFL